MEQKPTIHLESKSLEVSPRKKRRSWSLAEKRRIVAAVDECAHGGVGLLLRREGVYRTQVQAWRRELAQSAPLQAKPMRLPRSLLSSTTTGALDGPGQPEADLSASLRDENAALKAANAELVKRNGYLLEIIAIQKKVAAMCEHVHSPSGNG